MSLRYHVIVVLLASAAVHAALAPEHLSEAPTLGWAFVAATATAIVLALPLSWSASPVLLRTSAVLLASFAVAYVFTRTSSLPSLGIPHEEWDRLGLGTSALELVGAALALAATASPRARPAPHRAT